MTSEPTLSVVIPTNRSFSRVRRSLEAALSDQAPIEVLLVVDGPQSATLGPELDAFDASTPRLRVLRLPQRVGGEVARRIGAEAALGDVIWFLDDDVVPGKGTGFGHAARHAQGGWDIVVGPLHTPFESVPAESRVPAWFYEQSCGHEFAKQVADPSLILKGFWAGNYSMRRSALLKLESVPEVFANTRHSDRAFGLVCARAGLSAICAPELAATHNYAPSLDGWRLDCLKQGEGRTEIHNAFADLIGADVPNPWLNGLGRRGRLALRLAQRGPRSAAMVATVAAALTRLAAKRGQLPLALEFGRILRSVEQSRGARGMGSGSGFQVPGSGLRGSGSLKLNAAPADVSLLVVSRGPSARLRRVLEVWRPHVAEIVVVGDLSGEPGLIDAVSDLADRTATVERAFPIESVLEKCWPLCSRSFVFRGDDDEVPATVLLAELRSMTLDPTLWQAGIPMRWLWPNAETWIDGYPWTANPQPKLIRNLPGMMEFPGRVHTAEHLPMPTREVRLPIYHLRTLDDEAERRIRAVRYAGIGGGQRHSDGRRPNSQYVPEDAGPLKLVGVPDWDLAAVTSCTSVAGVAEVQRSQGARVQAPEPLDPRPLGPLDLTPLPRTLLFSAGANRSSVRVSALHRPATPGGCIVLEVVIANRSGTVIPGADRNGSRISVSTRWRRMDDNPAGLSRIVDGTRFAIGEAIPPGRSVSRTLALEMLVAPGQWLVSVDLVEEGVGWGGDGDEFRIDILPNTQPSRAPHREVDLFKAILIETRAHCNRKAGLGMFGPERQDAHGMEMDWSTIRRVLANLRDLDYRGRISWHGVNEPLQDPRIFDIVAESRDACPDAFLSLMTNGDLLTADAYDRLKPFVDMIGVSVYDEAVRARVGRFADGQLKMIDMRGIQPCRFENRAALMRRQAEEWRHDRLTNSDKSCERPSFMMQVKSSGKVALCCSDAQGDVEMGNVRYQRLEDIWYGDRFTNYRRTLAAEGRRNLPLCRNCAYNGEAGKIYDPLPDTVTHPKVQVGEVLLARAT